MFSGAENILVSGGTFISGLERPSIAVESGFKLLLQHTARGALFNSAERYDPPRCHPGTRMSIQNKIKAWIEAVERDFSVFWLNGPAGVGKSAILQMIAEHYSKRDRKYLLASFFFSRSAEGRNSERHLISTLAYQIALSLPQTRPLIEQAIEADPLIFDKSLSAQVEALITEPLTTVSFAASKDEKERWPRLIVIDGLDECQGPDVQHLILENLCSLAKDQIIPLAILIASRRERVIYDAFNLGDLNRLSTRFTLEQSYEADEDIQRFLEERCRIIRQQHESSLDFPVVWPSPEIITMLVRKSSGQFIYPSVIIKYIGSPHYNPIERMDVVCGLTTGLVAENPFADLDSLYHHIFSSIKTQYLVAALRILGVYIAYRNTDSRHSHSDIFSDTALTEDFLLLKRGDLRYTLADLESVLHISKGDIQFHHASLPEFLLDRTRSHDYHVDLELAHAHVCIYLLNSVAPLHAYALRSQVVRSQGYWWIGDLKHHIARAAPIHQLYEALRKLDIFELSGVLYIKARDTFPWDLLFFILEILHLSKFTNLMDIQNHHLCCIRSSAVMQLEKYKDEPMVHYAALLTSSSSFSAFFLASHSSTLGDVWGNFGTTLRCACLLGGESTNPDFDTIGFIRDSSHFPSGLETFRRFLRTLHVVPPEQYARTILFIMQFLFFLPPAPSLASDSWRRRAGSFWESVSRMDGQNHRKTDDHALLHTIATCLTNIVQPMFGDAGPFNDLEDFLVQPSMAARMDFLSQYMKRGFRKPIKDVVNDYLSACSDARQADRQRIMDRLTPERVVIPGIFDSPMLRSLGAFFGNP